MAKVTLEKPQFRFRSIMKILLGFLGFSSSLLLGIILSAFGLFIIGIPLLIFGALGSIPIFREARKHSKFWCTRCDKGIIVYKYEYKAICPRCRAGFQVEWENE